jgi:1,4-dihydroxy-2-naphthoyl-CoA hydrolase
MMTRDGARTNDAITVEASERALAGTFPGNLGIELLEITDETVRGRMRVDKRHLHPGGYVHGGCWVAFADTVAAWGTMRHLPQDRGFTTAELKMNVLGAGRVGDELLGVGELLHAGARTQVWEVRVYRAQAPERVVANFICTQMIL